MPYHIPNSRWNKEANTGREVEHSMVLCVKHGGALGGAEGVNSAPLSPYDIPNTLSVEEVTVMRYTQLFLLLIHIHTSWLL
jgi:hypothetical protein